MEHKASGEDISFPQQRIESRYMEKEVRQSFLEYSMSVITARALPDVRDGMKPGQRRILYAMYEDGLTHDKPFRKSATTVGNVLGRYHPHGDAAVYDTMVRLAQSFSLRYPLVEGHGNFGNVDGDPAAAYRYTEARMARISGHMMNDIEKNIVDFVPNFDNSRREPSVLPARFPNLLVNGAVGIAVGMATNIPPHNLTEVIDGTVYRMDHPDCSVEELMLFIKGPDFPTAGIIYGSRGMVDAYTTGKGRVIVRARARVEEAEHRIVVTEIPYMVNKSMLVSAMADLVKDKKIEGITDIRDESGRAGMRIVVEYRRDANGEVILNQLYKYTQLQSTCAVNMLALVGGEPRVLSLPDILDHYIRHQEEVIRRRTAFELDKAQAEMHIFEGYRIALLHIEEVIEIIRASVSIPDAKEKLMASFGLTEAQAQAIVEMTLGKLSGLERQKIEDRLEKLTLRVSELRAILADEEKIKDIIRTEMETIKEKYGDARRTELIEATDEIDLEDLIPRHTCVITVTHGGYIKRQPASTYAAQHRGGKGIRGMATKEEDFLEDVIVANSHEYLMFFTNKGRVYTKKAYRVPEASRTAKGTNLVNVLALSEGEFVTAIIPIAAFPDTEYLTMVTRRGVIKRTLLSEYAFQRKGGKRALTLDEGDELLFIRHTKGGADLLLVSRTGLAVRFTEENVRPMGRVARGVRGIRLGEDDRVIGVVTVEEGRSLLTITEKGFGKRTDFEEFRTMKNRGGHGVRCHTLSEKTGLLAGVSAVTPSDDLMLITSDGVIIRTPVEGIPSYSRTAGGVIVMRLDEEVRVSSLARLEAEEEIEEEIENAPEVLDVSEVRIEAEGGEDADESEEVPPVEEPDDGDTDGGEDGE